jgi:hypothetical protein
MANDLTGSTFNNWTVLSPTERIDRRGRRHWMCRCTCGKEKAVLDQSLASGGSKSCGCKMSALRSDTWNAKYGKHPSLTDIDTIKRKVFEIHGDRVTMDESTYVGAYKECRFVDYEYGEFYCRPARVIRRGTGHPARTMQRREATCMRRFGVTTALLDPATKEMARQTSLAHFGTEHPTQNDEVKARIAQTCLERFGTTSALGNDDVRKKGAQTCMERYGTDVVLRSPGVKARVIATNLERYGCEWSAQNPDIRSKTDKTMHVRYGGPSSMNDHDVAKRNARAQTRSVRLTHWSTGEELVCIGSYEVRVVQYLNNHQIRFQWQPTTFKMPADDRGKAKTYRPDLYLTDAGAWVEIKGYFRKDAREKWDWFHVDHPNSMLWDKEALKDLGLL